MGMIRRLLINQEHREKLALIEGDREYRYVDLLRKAWSLLPFLPGRQQETVAILLPNGGDYIAAFWGTVMAGMTAFPLNNLMTGHELLPMLGQVSAGTLITTKAYKRVLEEAPGLAALSLKIIFLDELEPDTLEREYAEVTSGKDDPMLLLSTSGTTGKSKIVQLSERNVETAVLGYLDKLCFDAAELDHVRYILAVPFSSVYGMMILSACLMRSFPIVVMDSDFTLDALYRLTEKYKITHYEGSGSVILLMEQMAGRAIPYDIRSLQYFGFGGSKISGKTIENVHRAYPGMAFYQGYGMTETSPLITKHPQGKLEKPDSAGTAIKGVELAVETENEITAAPYTRGEIVVRGPNVMLGYLNDNLETSRVLKNGYIYTGDIGYLDEEGYLYICGRKKNIIIVRGFNVYPEEIESCIQNSLLAKECVVYGRMDGYGNETVCAEVVPIHPRIDENAIKMYCEEHLAEYKRPRKISLCESIRKNASGKAERYRQIGL